MRGIEFWVVAGVAAGVLVTGARAQYVPDVGPGRCVANCGSSSGSSSTGSGYTPGAGPDLSALIEHLFTLPPGKKAMLEGWQALKAGRRSTAESKFREALRHDRRLPDAWLGLAEVHAAKGQLREALGYANKARSVGANGAPGPRRMIGKITRALRSREPKAAPPKRRRRHQWKAPKSKAEFQARAEAKVAAQDHSARERVKARFAALEAKRQAAEIARAQAKRRAAVRERLRAVRPASPVGGGSGAVKAFGRGAVPVHEAELVDRNVGRPGGPQTSASSQLRSAELHSDRARRMVITPATPTDGMSERQAIEAGRAFDTRGDGLGSLVPLGGR